MARCGQPSRQGWDPKGFNNIESVPALVYMSLSLRHRETEPEASLHSSQTGDGGGMGGPSFPHLSICLLVCLCVCLFVWCLPVCVVPSSSGSFFLPLSHRTAGQRQNDIETERQNDIDTERQSKGTSRGEMGPSRSHLVVRCDQVGHIAL